MLERCISFFKDWRNQSSYFRWLMKYTKPYAPYLGFMIMITTVSSLSGVVLAVISQKIIDGASNDGTFLPQIGVYIGIMVIGQVLNIVGSLISVVIDEKFSFGIRKQVYDKILNTKWMDVSKYHTGDLMTRLTSDTNEIANGIANTLPTMIMLFVQLVATFFTLFAYNKLLACFALMIAPIAILVSFVLGRKLKTLQVKVQESESTYRSFINESLSNLMIIKTFCDEDYSSNRLSELRTERFRWVLKKSRMGIATSTVLNVTFQLGYLVAFVYGVLCISRGEITYGTMTVFLTLVNRVQAPLLGLANCIPQIVSVLASSGRVIEIQNLSQEERIDTEIVPEKVGVVINKVSFGYKNDTVLDSVDTVIHPGEFVAIVGESGCGKTTLIRLLMSFVNANEGNIKFFDGLDYDEDVNANSRKFISYVPQGNTLFSGTIASCVRMGKRDATEQEIIDALKVAAAYEFVMELPLGIETVIGEKGHGLSEGQAQRIAIARAVIHKAPFLILDEATSSLDEVTELKVLEGIRNFQPFLTCILITHRRSVLKYCHRELKIQDKSMSELNLAFEG